MNRTTPLVPVVLAALLYGAASHAQTPVAAVASPAPTQVSDDPEAANTIRIVRLSQTRGTVQMDRNIGVGFEAAFNNLPITQGARLKTGEGTAEVEFEDGTTLRLIPDTQVDFKQLGRSATGATLSGMNVLSGTVYVTLTKTKGNSFNLSSGDGVIKPRPGAHLRLEVKASESRLSVVAGTADFTSTSGTREVGKMKSLIFNTSAPVSADLIAGIEDGPFDTWDEQQAEYHKRYNRGNALAGSGSAYGLADLNYYGAFSNVDGCGRVWRPYFASAAWDPYASGVWAWYPASGYSWVSPYPWGWAPFHYGSWMQCGGGWGWQPSGSWYGLGNARDPRRDHPGHHPPHDPIRLHPSPPRPRPISGRVTSMVAVNEKPLTFSHVDQATGTFNFRNDSAGLGVPRGEFNRLNKLSESAARTGSSNVPVFFPPQDRADVAPVHSGSPTTHDDKASGARVSDHAGFFSRPGNQNPGAHNGYAERGGDPSSADHGSAAPQGAGSPGTAAGYANSNHPQGDRGSNGGYRAGNPANGSGYSATPRNGGNGGSYSGGGGGYSSGSHPAAGTYSGGGSGNSGGPRAGGGGYTGGGGSRPSAPAPSGPAPSAPMSSPAPAPSAPGGHR